jgi:hypothetical protein
VGGWSPPEFTNRVDYFLGLCEESKILLFADRSITACLSHCLESTLFVEVAGPVCEGSGAKSRQRGQVRGVHLANRLPETGPCSGLLHLYRFGYWVPGMQTNQPVPRRGCLLASESALASDCQMRTRAPREGSIDLPKGKTNCGGFLLLAGAG